MVLPVLLSSSSPFIPCKCVKNMNAELSNLIGELENITAEAKAKFSGLSSEQLNWKPAAGSWSVGQCFDHLITANRGMAAKIEPVTQGKQKATFFEKLPFLPKLFGGFITRAVAPESPRKIKNPGIFDPAESDISADVIERFLEDQNKIAAVMRAGGNVDPEKIIMTSPVAVFITYSLLDGYRIIVWHEKRHLQQAERVMQTGGFPGNVGGAQGA